MEIVPASPCAGQTTRPRSGFTRGPAFGFLWGSWHRGGKDRVNQDWRVQERVRWNSPRQGMKTGRSGEKKSKTPHREEKAWVPLWSAAPEKRDRFLNLPQPQLGFSGFVWEQAIEDVRVSSVCHSEALKELTQIVPREQWGTLASPTGYVIAIPRSAPVHPPSFSRTECARAHDTHTPQACQALTALSPSGMSRFTWQLKRKGLLDHPSNYPCKT